MGLSPRARAGARLPSVHRHLVPWYQGQGDGRLPHMYVATPESPGRTPRHQGRRHRGWLGFADLDSDAATPCDVCQPGSFALEGRVVDVRQASPGKLSETASWGLYGWSTFARNSLLMMAESCARRARRAPRSCCPTLGCHPRSRVGPPLIGQKVVLHLPLCARHHLPLHGCLSPDRCDAALSDRIPVSSSGNRSKIGQQLKQ